MAGYFTKLNGYVYTGEYKASADVPNGTFVVADNAALTAKNPASSLATYGFKCIEKTSVYGLPALRLDVVKVDNAGGEAFFVENVLDPICDNYNEAEHTIKTGEYLRMRKPELGDQLLVSVPAAVYSAAAVGGIFVIGANGVLAAAA